MAVVVSGNPRPGSRTLALALAVGQALGTSPSVIDLGALGPRLLDKDDPELIEDVAAIRAADVLVVATPTYKGSYTGVLKVFLDYLPHQGLAGVVAVPVTVGASPQQAAQSERHLRGLLTELGARVRTGLAATEAQLGDQENLVAGFLKEIA